MPTPAAQRGMDAIRQRWPTARPSFGVNCRNIAGTNTRSQHAYGNAIDTFGPGNALEEIYQYFNAARASMSVNTVCYRGRGGCTTPHNDHVHVDFYPKMSGPCGQGTASGVVPGNEPTSAEPTGLGELLGVPGLSAAIPNAIEHEVVEKLTRGVVGLLGLVFLAVVAVVAVVAMVSASSKAAGGGTG